jgi:hypothetical protein
MKRIFIIFLISFTLFSYSETNRKIFDIILSKGDSDRDLYIAYSWDYKNPVKIEYDYLDRFVRSFDLEPARGYFIEIKDKDDNFWFAYKFDIENYDVKLTKDLSMQSVEIEASWKNLPRTQELFLFYEGNLIPFKLSGGRFYLEMEFPVKKNIDLYFKDSGEYIFGPVKYYGENAYKRKVNVTLF